MNNCLKILLIHQVIKAILTACGSGIDDEDEMAFFMKYMQ